ncbi:MAG: serine/threonine protein phosphatase, partial [Firmicutes bacterium HGW-Firmicutes-12]
GDVLLLCTDGLHGHVKENDIELILSENISLGAKLNKMIELALERGGTDNITAILVNY